MDTAENKTANEEQITLFGRSVTATFEIDEQGKQPAPEAVVVRRVALRNLGLYSTALGVNEAAEISFYTGKPMSWAENLTEESVTEIVDLGRELSKKRFANFGIRSNRFAAMVAKESPELGKMALELQNRAIASRLGGA